MTRRALRGFVAVLATIPLAGLWAVARAQSPAPGASPLPEGWYARVETDRGAFVIHLFPEQAPQSVAHFAAYADGRMPWRDPLTGQLKKNVPYYDGVTVHKVIPMDHIELGDWTATGNGSPPVYVPPELGGPEDFNHPFRVGLTRASGGRISGSLFFVTMVSAPYYNGRHPCIGEVVQGREIVQKLCGLPVDESKRPLTPPKVAHVTIFKSGEPAPIPDPVPYHHVTPKLGPKPLLPAPSGS